LIFITSQSKGEAVFGEKDGENGNRNLVQREQEILLLKTLKRVFIRTSADILTKKHS